MSRATCLYVVDDAGKLLGAIDLHETREQLVGVGETTPPTAGKLARAARAVRPDADGHRMMDVFYATGLEELPVVIVEEDVVDLSNAHRHDPAKLAAALMRLLQEDRISRPRSRRIGRQAATAS